MQGLLWCLIGTTSVVGVGLILFDVPVVQDIAHPSKSRLKTMTIENY